MSPKQSRGSREKKQQPTNKIFLYPSRCILKRQMNPDVSHCFRHLHVNYTKAVLISVLKTKWLIWQTLWCHCQINPENSCCNILSGEIRKSLTITKSDCCPNWLLSCGQSFFETTTGMTMDSLPGRQRKDVVITGTVFWSLELLSPT